MSVFFLESNKAFETFVKIILEEKEGLISFEAFDNAEGVMVPTWRENGKPIDVSLLTCSSEMLVVLPAVVPFCFAFHLRLCSPAQFANCLYSSNPFLTATSQLPCLSLY